jgi:hypothetical protein
MDEKNRPAQEIARDFEMLNSLLAIHKRETDFKEFSEFTFDFELILKDYEFYLESKKSK